MRSLRIFGLLAMIGMIASCGGGSDGHDPDPGPLTLTLNTPNADDGALLFKVVGGAVDSISGGVMVQDGNFAAVSGGTRVVLAGDITDGVVATIWVPDLANASRYSVTMEQVAVRGTNAQRSIAGYGITVAP